MITVQKILLLRSVDLLSGLGTRELGAMARQAQEISVPAGSTILREGELGHTLFVIISGTVSVTRAEHRYATLSDGAYFGEISVLTGAPATATVAAESDCLLLSIEQHDLYDILANDFDAVLIVIRTICRRLGQLGGLQEYQQDEAPAQARPGET